MAKKEEIVAKLVELGIEHDASATKAELEKLLPEGAIVEQAEEDAPHKAFRAMMEAYAVQNPVKFASKKEEFERKLAGKLAFGMAPDGSLLDGRLDQNGKKIPVEIVVAK